jgi:hypothetical protein
VALNILFILNNSLEEPFNIVYKFDFLIKNNNLLRFVDSFYVKIVNYFFNTDLIFNNVFNVEYLYLIISLDNYFNRGDFNDY